MPTQEWPAQDYAIGSFIQASIAQEYLTYLDLEPTASVLDIGCGNGAFSRNILDIIPEGEFCGIDASENMLVLAKQELSAYPHITLKQADVLNLPFTNQFDCVVSFWCLQWCAFAIEKAFLNIYNALKPNGKVFTIFPSGDDPFITSYYKLQESNIYPSLHDFKSPVDFSHFQNLEEKLKALPFKNLRLDRIPHKLRLPSLDVFRKFVNGLAFFQGQVPNHEIHILNEALVEIYNRQCQEKFAGEYWFALSFYLVRAEK